MRLNEPFAGRNGASPPWHALSTDEAVRRLAAVPDTGLSSAEAAQRLERYGRNRLDEARREAPWRAFLRQFQDLMIVILLVAAVVSAVVAKEWETPVAIVVVVLLNATLGFIQESRAEASLEALKKMSVSTAVVRRDGATMRVNAEDLVPGDVVVHRRVDVRAEREPDLPGQVGAGPRGLLLPNRGDRHRFQPRLVNGLHRH